MKAMYNEQFGQVGLGPGPKRSKIVMTKTHADTFGPGYLIPNFFMEVMPGDEVHIEAHMYARLGSPLIGPLMDEIYMEYAFFEVSYRWLWDNFIYFMGEVEDPYTNPTEPADFLVPIVNFSGDHIDSGEIWDHLGLPTEVDDILVTCWAGRAYNLIINEWFRNPVTQDSRPVPTDDGPDNISDFGTWWVNKRKDYFTSCLPYAQKFDEVTIPLGDYANVWGTEKAINLTDDPDELTGVYVYGQFHGGSGSLMGATSFAGRDAGYSGAVSGYPGSNTALGFETKEQADALGDDPFAYADLTNAVAASVNDLREMIVLQQMRELEARAGSRYIEIIFNHFRVKSPDMRHQRPVYIGGGKQPIIIHEVVQTGTEVTAGSTKPGTVNAHADTYLKVNARGYITEHGCIMGLVWVRAPEKYQHGIPAHFRKRTKEEFFWPLFEQLGEQPVYNAEIFAQGTSADEEIFGYQERYAEYRYMQNTVGKRFKSNHPQSLDFMHLGADESTLPSLTDPAWHYSDLATNLSRCVANSGDYFFMYDSKFVITAIRQMAVRSIPGLDRI